MSPQTFVFGPFVLDVRTGSLMREGRPLVVGHKALLLLQALLRASGQPLSKEELINAAWPGLAVEESNLSVQIAALRKLLGPTAEGSEWIVTIPRLGYRFSRAPGPSENPPEGAMLPRPVDGADPRERPSIVVLPFSNLSDDKDQEYLADGITEDIITALTRFRWFFVIARNSSFAYKGKLVDSKKVANEIGVRYILEGSVRKSDRSLRVSAQLVDATNGNQLWAERYDLELTDVFAIQDAIAERVAGAIEPELLRSESVLATTRHTGNMTAWDLVRQGTWQFHQVTRETHLAARGLFRQACTLDPELPEAPIWLARVSAGVVAYGWSGDAGSDIREGVDAAVKAIHLDEKNPYAHYGLAITSVYANVHEQAIRAAEKAVEISPSFALGHLALGIARLFGGHAHEAIAPFKHGLQLNAYDPQNFVWYNMLALAQYFSDRPDQALDSAVKAVKIRPTWRAAYEVVALCQAASGRLDEARRTFDRMRGLSKPADDILGPLKRQNPQWERQMVRTLRDAGWRE